MPEYSDDRLPPRFWAKVDDSDTCWRWTGALNHGYGYVRWEGRSQNAHRVAYQVLVGPIAPGFDVDHLCHGWDESCAGGPACPHRSCVNPAHLEAVPPKTNKLRGRSPLAVHAAKTHCPNSHPLSGDNLWIDHGGRTCRTCKLARNAAWRAANREKWLKSNRKYADMTPEQRQRHREAVARYKSKRKAQAAPS